MQSIRSGENEMAEPINLSIGPECQHKNDPTPPPPPLMLWQCGAGAGIDIGV
jgi:hypothetical protein